MRKLAFDLMESKTATVEFDVTEEQYENVIEGGVSPEDVIPEFEEDIHYALLKGDWGEIEYRAK